MPEGGKPQGSADPTALWRQWSETTSQAWSSALAANKDQYADSYNLYRSWLKSMGATPELTKLNPLGMMNPREIWKLWFDSTVGVWRTTAESGGDPMGLIRLWLKLMEETQAKILSGEALPTNLFAFYKQWYDATSDTWARFVEDTIGSEKFLELVRPFLESYTTFIKTFRNAEEEYLRILQLPTRSDVARVAELVISLEEKVDQIDDAFEEGYARLATRQSIAELDRRLGQVESKLDPLPTILDQVRPVEGLTQRLGRVESKLDTLPAALEKASEVEHLTQRMDQVESKLNAVLAALEQLVAKASTGPDKPSNTVPRKAPKKKTQQQEVKNPESAIGAE